MTAFRWSFTRREVIRSLVGGSLLLPAILSDLLRTKLQFKGLVLTDDLEMHAILDHHSIEEAAVRALSAHRRRASPARRPRSAAPSRRVASA